MTIAVKQQRINVREYYRLGEVGILRPEDRTELIEGEVIEMAPIGDPHASTVDRLTYLFVRRFGERAIVRVQNPLWLSEWSLPQPDVILLEHRADFYYHRTPHPEDVHLVVEVSDTTTRFDRQTKVPLYARSGVREVWLLVLGSDCVEVYRGLEGSAYTERAVLHRGERVTPAAFPEVTLTVDELLGPMPTD